MITKQKVGRLRLMQWINIVILVLLAGAFVWLQGQSLPTTYDYGVLAGIVLLLFTLGLIQRRADSWLMATSLQSSFAASEEFSTLYQSSPVAYITLDSKGKILDFNPAAIRLLQGESDTMIDETFFDRINPDFDFSVILGKIKSGLTVNEEEVPLLTFENQHIWTKLSVHSRPFEEKRMLSLIDITEQRAVDTAKSEFVALATHQLRTPIAAIRWNVELLEKKMKDSITDDQSRYLVKVNRNVQRMVSLINDFLSVSKLEMGTFANTQEAVNLTTFVDSIVDEFSEKISQKGLTLNRVDNPPHLQVMTDSRLLHIIVSNLMSNASKYSNPNGTLEFSYTLEGTMLEIVIKDDGIGIPENELERLFSKFFRATNAQVHQTQGTGLGLYVVKQSVEKLGGTIAVSSQENAGAQFTVKLPVTVLSNVSDK
jgi:PAS domain S-box-containing protein